MHRLIHKYPARRFSAILLAIGFIAVIAHPVTHHFSIHGQLHESHQQKDNPLPAEEECLECILTLSGGSDMFVSALFYLPPQTQETVENQSYVAESYSADGFTLRGPPSMLYI